LTGQGFDYNPTPLPDADAKLVVASLTTFVQVHQALLNVVIGKHGLITLIPFFEPIRVSLVSLEAIVDTFAFALIGLIPTQKPAAETQFNSLGITVKFAVETYQSPFIGAEIAEVQTGAKLVDVIVGAFKEVTDLSNQLRIETEKINNFNAGVQGVKISQGFSVIIAKVTTYTAALVGPNPSPLPDVDAQLVVDALTTFVQVHQALLNVVIGKHGLFALIPFFAPIRISLVNLEIVVDSFAFALIGLIPTRKDPATTQVKSLDVTIGKAIDTYSTPFLAAAIAQEQTGAKLVDVIVGAFKEVTALSDQLRIETQKINNFNAPIQGFKIAQGFSTIILKVTGYTAALVGNPSPLPDADAQLVVDALTTFVQVHQALLNVVIGKHGLFAMVPFFEPIRLSLVTLEGVVDSFAFTLIGLIPTQEKPATAQVKSLDVTIGKAVDVYSTPLRKAAPAFEGHIDH
jgi:glycopeptide antibiotics resistance protein